METVLQAGWTFLNSPLGITLIVSLLVWGINWLYAKKPAYEKYAGSIISAIRFAEKQIPDTVSNTAAARLDVALKYVLQIYERAEGRRATEREKQELVEGIQLLHTEVEATGGLHKDAPPTESVEG